MFAAEQVPRSRGTCRRVSTRLPRSVPGRGSLARGLLLFVLLATSGGFSAASDFADGPALLSLDEAVDLALKQNPDYLGILSNIELAELDMEQARSAYRTKFYSSLNTDARIGSELGSTYNIGVRKQRESGSQWNVGFYSSTFGDSSLSELRFAYTLPFFRNPLSTGEFTVAGAELGYRHKVRLSAIAAEELILQIVNQYYGLVLAVNKVNVARGQMDVAHRLEHATRIRAGTGRSSELDLRMAELRVGQAKHQRQVALLDQDKAESRLKLALGLDLSRPIAVDRSIPPVANIEIVELPPEAVEERALERRAELAGLREEVEMSRRKLRSQSGRTYPGIDVSLQYSLVGDGDSVADSMNLNDTRVGIGVSMDMDGRSEEQREQRRLLLQYESRERALEKLEGEIRAEARAATLAVQESAGQLRLARELLDLTQQQFSYTELRYRNGSAGTEDVLEKQQSLSDARHAELVARVSYLLSSYTLQAADGSLVEDWTR